MKSLAIIFGLIVGSCQFGDGSGAATSTTANDITYINAVANAAINIGTSLTGTSVHTLSATANRRNIVIEITNHLNTPLYGGNHYLCYGQNIVPPTPSIKPMTREVTQFESFYGSLAGTAGILAFKVGSHEDLARFAIAFSVPYNYMFSTNWFGLKWIGAKEPVNKALFKAMKKDNAWDSSKPQISASYAYAKEGKPSAIYHNDYIVSASMSMGGRAILKVEVTKIPGAYERNHKFYHKKK